MKTGTITLAAAVLATFAGAAAAQNTTVTTGTETTGTTENTTTGGTTGGTTTGGTTNDLSLPTKNHSSLITSMIGRWQTTTKLWTTPETEPQTARGITTMTATLGGRFVQQDFACSMGGSPFKGTGFFGFNNTNGRFESFWIDNCSTGMQMSTGERQSDGSIVWNLTFTDENGATQNTKTVTRFPAKDTVVFETYAVGTNGSEFKTLEVTYNRTNQITPAGNNRLSKTTNTTNTNNTTTTGNFNGTTTTTTTTTTDASQNGTTTETTPVVPQ
jgi:hypothetical protein